VDRPWLFPVAAVGVLVGFVVAMVLFTESDDGRRRTAEDTTTASAESTQRPGQRQDQVGLPPTIAVGGHFLDRPGSLELVSAVGAEPVRGDETLTFETFGATCSVVSTSMATGEPAGTKQPALVVANRTGEVMRGSEYDADGSLTVRLPSRNGSDVIDVSCGDPATTRVFAELVWEP
jgi:hypothetical protein